MHYVCIENNTVVGVLGYRPTVPNSVSVVEISDEQNTQLIAGTHVFDVSSRIVRAVDNSVLTQRSRELSNSQEREFLNSTDWKVMRHIRQKALGLPTSLSDAQYIELEQQRHSAANRIV